MSPMRSSFVPRGTCRPYFSTAAILERLHGCSDFDERVSFAELESPLNQCAANSYALTACQPLQIELQDRLAPALGCVMQSDSVRASKVRGSD